MFFYTEGEARLRRSPEHRRSTINTIAEQYSWGKVSINRITAQYRKAKTPNKDSAICWSH